ncbi:MAG: hypothetical protein A3J48_02885 [Candidatus Doudnabacteria bacterium RIFCSPHIGHO2_02_FULL_46_11]|uniref:Adenylate kinase n=1 Tax=Candidatus Doudnabacteria bacterium RIFCSPHIGHO2_02_FULL_46_11 TaxID=1817832 RepID=A0A1F5P5I7_9BACT|nr:MAG: hypothetical protein A3J48_02885 [Candidatus Doudnabacteria bacterium RIFCSPHIGHO2_02_FULL_46_11]
MSKKTVKSSSELPLIIFLGPQGSGKGTQTRLLVEKYGFHLTEMGGMLRAEAKKKTGFGRMIKEKIEGGKLVPSWVAMQLLKNDVKKNIKKPIVVDGAPRQYIEAIGHERNIKKLGRKITMIFFISLTNEEGMRRLLLRGRNDDTPEKIKVRLAWSRAKLGSIVKYFSRKYPVVEINGAQSVVKVHQSIISALKKNKVI